jgi:hypothetical protein
MVQVHLFVCMCMCARVNIVNVQGFDMHNWRQRRELGHRMYTYLRACVRVRMSRILCMCVCAEAWECV